LEWLRAEWRPKPNWRRVLDTTAMLISGFSLREQVPDQLVQLAAVAVSLLGSDGARVALGHLDTALSWVGDTPSCVRCRVLRMRASTLRVLGKTHEAMLTLDAAHRTAVLLNDPREEASTLCDLGLHLRQSGHLERAERVFRRGASLPIDDAPYLLATLHHQLALVLCEDRAQLDEAEQHAEAALALRWDKNARLAEEDRALLARIRDARSLPSPCPTSRSMPSGAPRMS
jgi:tetratricopeptide (TPR) repeat protein